MVRWSMFRTYCVAAAVLMLSPLGVAAECEVNADAIGAHYAISQPSGHTTALQLWRLGDRALQVRPEAKLADSYRSLSNGEVRRVRYFDAHQRAIEYDPEAADWSAKAQLLPAQALKKMQRIGSKGSGCKRIERYQRELADGQLTVWWNPALRLLLQLERRNSDGLTRIKLVDLKVDTTTIREAFAARADYVSTDYADIGDNESDPFLRKMIRVGFVEHAH